MQSDLTPSAVGKPTKYEDLCIHQIFEKQVEHRPHAIAITDGRRNLSYKELDRFSNAIAEKLKRKGIKRSAFVGVCADRSIEMIVGILAVLKTGGGYVPLDVHYPSERLKFIIRDANLQFILTQKGCESRLQENQDKKIVIDLEEDGLGHAPKLSSSPKDVAYVIYTSGSTGTPKGVQVTHHNVVRLFEATEPWFRFNTKDVWTLFHSFAFDFSVWEMWGALLYGGRLVVVPYLTTRDPNLFHRLLIEERVSVLNQTPSAFRQLLNCESFRKENHKLPLRYIIFGGEALNVQGLKPWFDRYEDTQPKLINMYGITETTVHATYRPITRKDLFGNARSPIGIPIPDLKIHVLDKHLQPVPVGEIGEMYIGGEGVSLGYLNQSSLTAERFIQDPFDGQRTGRLYKSGDLARRLRDGDLEYIGRIDHQVKIRGFRVELGEIETIMTQHPDVQEAIVILDDSPPEKRLIAYIVLKATAKSDMSDLRTYASTHLPDYMVPALFIPLDALPLTLNGKVDVRSLPKPNPSRPDLKQAFSPPVTPEEKLLAKIWSEVLGIEKIGVKDSFFDLGGDSMRSIQILAKAAEQDLRFSLDELFKHQNIRSLLQATKNKRPKVQAPSSQVTAFSLISHEDRHRLPDSVVDAYPMAKLQEGMCFHSEYDPDSAIYHDVFTYRISQQLHLDLLQKAAQRLSDRHAALRTAFDLHNFEQPLQLVHRHSKILLEVEDLQRFSPEEQQDRVLEWIAKEKHKPFDWNTPPLLRLRAFPCKKEMFYLGVSFHHVILDGWSLAVLLTELLQDYTASIGKTKASIKAPLLLYRDFVALEQNAIKSEECQRFWDKNLENMSVSKLPRWPIPKDQRRDQFQSQTADVPKEVFQDLKKVAIMAESPLKSVLLAAHNKMISFLTGQTDIVTGLVVNGRPEEKDGERVLGLFLNTVPFRISVTGGTWMDLIQSAFKIEREILPYRRYPMAEIQRRSGMGVLFETAFDFVQFHIYKNLLEGEKIQFAENACFEANSFPFFVSFVLDISSSHLKLLINYNASELSDKQIETIIGYYLNTLRAIATNPKDRYELHSPLSESEKETLLVTWNCTEAEFPKGKCIQELFEVQARKTPNACAVVFEDQKLTYNQLDQKANQLARHLQSIGIKSDSYVAVYMDRCLEMVPALLGILKAGAAYVPIEATYPASRVKWILSSLKIPCVITHAATIPVLRDIQDDLSHLKHVVCLESLPSFQKNKSNSPRYWQSSEIERQSSQPLPRQQKPEDTAYVIFTSGSTGTPKGVVIRHESVVNLIHWVNNTFQIGPSDRVLFITSLCFDLSVYDVFGFLAAGASIHVASRYATQDPENLLQMLLHEPITFWDSAPAAFQQLVPFLSNTKSKQAPATLRLVFLSGDWIPLTLPAIIRSQFSKAEVVGLGGATEATIWSNYFRVKEIDPAWVSIPYGKPIQNCQYYILNQHLQPCPIGTPGDLYIGGICLSSGYIHEPILTQEKFIQHPYHRDPKAKLYKTGDLARYFPDGNIEFLGRNDHQVKVRGFRIELGEIETVLGQNPAIETSLVIPKGEKGDKKLIAYIVLKKDFKISTNELRDFVKARLPDYMLPAHFVLLERFPLTSNGKVDRHALLAFEETKQSCKESCMAPRTELEAVLVGIWGELLKVNKVGIYDDFFDLGGHSLLATQLISRIRSTFQTEIPLRYLFDEPTIAGFASKMCEDQTRGKKVEQIAQLLLKVSQLSEEQVESLLSERNVS